MYIKKDGNKLIVTFKYEPQIVAAIKQVQGRKWNAKYKQWEIPVASVEEAIEILKPIGFIFHKDVDKEFQKFLKRRQDAKRFRNTVTKIKTSLPLMDFQHTGAGFARVFDSVLIADAPGLGKTLQVIAALEGTPGPHLILVPASLKYSWAEELEKWTNVSFKVIDGDKKTREKQWSNRADYPFYFIANYELLLRDADIMVKIPWNAIVCDEAHRISNPQAKTTKALKKIKSKKRIALSGTPINNTPVDIYSIIDWLEPGYLGTYYQFQDKYCVMDDWADPTWRKVAGYKNLDLLAKKIEPYMIRRTKEEVLKNFPKKTSTDIVFEMSQEEKNMYKSVQLSIFKELQEMKIKGENLNMIVVKMLRLRQLTNDSRLIADDPVPSSKLATLKDLLVPIMETLEDNPR